MAIVRILGINIEPLDNMARAYLDLSKHNHLLFSKMQDGKLQLNRNNTLAEFEHKYQTSLGFIAKCYQNNQPLNIPLRDEIVRQLEQAKQSFIAALDEQQKQLLANPNRTTLTVEEIVQRGAALKAEYAKKKQELEENYQALINDLKDLVTMPESTIAGRSHPNGILLDNSAPDNHAYLKDIIAQKERNIKEPVEFDFIDHAAGQYSFTAYNDKNVKLVRTITGSEKEGYTIKYSTADNRHLYSRSDKLAIWRMMVKDFANFPNQRLNLTTFKGLSDEEKKILIADWQRYGRSPVDIIDGHEINHKVRIVMREIVENRLSKAQVIDYINMDDRIKSLVEYQVSNKGQQLTLTDFLPDLQKADETLLSRQMKRLGEPLKIDAAANPPVPDKATVDRINGYYHRLEQLLIGSYSKKTQEILQLQRKNGGKKLSTKDHRDLSQQEIDRADSLYREIYMPGMLKTDQALLLQKIKQGASFNPEVDEATKARIEQFYERYLDMETLVAIRCNGLCDTGVKLSKTNLATDNTLVLHVNKNIATGVYDKQHAEHVAYERKNGDELAQIARNVNLGPGLVNTRTNGRAYGIKHKAERLADRSDAEIVQLMLNGSLSSERRSAFFHKDCHQVRRMSLLDLLSLNDPHHFNAPLQAELISSVEATNARDLYKDLPENRQADVHACLSIELQQRCDPGRPVSRHYISDEILKNAPRNLKDANSLLIDSLENFQKQLNAQRQTAASHGTPTPIVTRNALQNEETNFENLLNIVLTTDEQGNLKPTIGMVNCGLLLSPEYYSNEPVVRDMMSIKIAERLIKNINSSSAALLITQMSIAARAGFLNVMNERTKPPAEEHEAIVNKLAQIINEIYDAQVLKQFGQELSPELLQALINSKFLVNEIAVRKLLSGVIGDGSEAARVAKLVKLYDNTELDIVLNNGGKSIKALIYAKLPVKQQVAINDVLVEKMKLAAPSAPFAGRDTELKELLTPMERAQNLKKQVLEAAYSSIKEQVKAYRDVCSMEYQLAERFIQGDLSLDLTHMAIKNRKLPQIFQTLERINKKFNKATTESEYKECLEELKKLDQDPAMQQVQQTIIVAGQYLADVARGKDLSKYKVELCQYAAFMNEITAKNLLERVKSIPEASCMVFAHLDAKVQKQVFPGLTQKIQLEILKNHEYIHFTLEQKAQAMVELKETQVREVFFQHKPLDIQLLAKLSPEQQVAVCTAKEGDAHKLSDATYNDLVNRHAATANEKLIRELHAKRPIQDPDIMRNYNLSSPTVTVGRTR
jgi:hypothetical protein